MSLLCHYVRNDQAFTLCCGLHPKIGYKSNINMLNTYVLKKISHSFPKVAQFMVCEKTICDGEHKNKLINVIDGKVNVIDIGNMCDIIDIDVEHDIFAGIKFWCDDMLLCQLNHVCKANIYFAKCNIKFCIYKLDETTNKYYVHDTIKFKPKINKHDMMCIPYLSEYLITSNYINMVFRNCKPVFVRINRNTKKVCHIEKLDMRGDIKLYDDNNFVVFHLDNTLDHYQMNEYNEFELIKQYSSNDCVFDCVNQKIVTLKYIDRDENLRINGTTILYDCTNVSLRNDTLYKNALDEFNLGNDYSFRYSTPIAISPNANDINDIILCMQDLCDKIIFIDTHDLQKYNDIHLSRNTNYNIIGRIY